MLALPAGLAIHCEGNVFTLVAGDETLYLDVRENQETQGEYYVYVESNNQPGLQRGFETFVCPSNPDDPYCKAAELLWTDYCTEGYPDTLLVGYDGPETTA